MNIIKVKWVIAQGYFLANKYTVNFIGVAFKRDGTVFINSSLSKVKKGFIKLNRWNKLKLYTIFN